MRKSWTHDYIAHVLREKKQSLSALAATAGVSSTTLTRWRNSEDYSHDLSMKTLKKIESTSGISFTPFMEGKPEVDHNAAKDHTISRARTLVSIYDVQASAGHGSIVESEQVIDRLAFPPGYLKRITSASEADLAIIGVKGDSMLPTLKDDDVVMLDTAKTSLGFDGLFVLRLDGALHVKRISRSSEPGLISIISDNKSEYPTVSRKIEDIEVIGKVIWMGKKV